MIVIFNQERTYLPMKFLDEEKVDEDFKFIFSPFDIFGFIVGCLI